MCCVYSTHMSVWAWVCASWWNHYVFLHWRDFRPLRKLQLPDRAIHLPPLTSAKGSQTDLIKICSCFPSRCLSLFPSLPISPLWLSFFSFPHCASENSSCFSWICFFCHMTNPKEFWSSVVIHWLFSDPSFCLLISLHCPHYFPLFLSFHPELQPHSPTHVSGGEGSGWFTCAPQTSCMWTRNMCPRACMLFDFSPVIQNVRSHKKTEGITWSGNSLTFFENQLIRSEFGAGRRK